MSLPTGKSLSPGTTEGIEVVGSRNSSRNHEAFTTVGPMLPRICLATSSHHPATCGPKAVEARHANLFGITRASCGAGAKTKEA
ncbi:MAG: hypothetical protein DMG13_28535 [Acidobacteria bacterium]|nr:MAG: hypothetical protein DMG13_28535 [Acidobacteriota bacterium]